MNQGRTAGGNMRVAPEDDVTPADRPELQDEEDNSASFPVRVQVTVTREGKGALAIECLAQDGEISIENVYHFPNAELAEAKTAEKDWARRSLYTGPPFGQLDEDLQMLLERFLEERGINTQMALFIPEYIDLKEQKEYIGWLNSKFTAAHVSVIDTNEHFRHEELRLVKPTRQKRRRLEREVNLYITEKGRFYAKTV